MKYKKIIYSVFLILLFSALWCYLNRNYLSELEELGIRGVVYLTSSRAGYNYMVSHASMYTLFFLVFLVIDAPENMIQILVRKKRCEFIKMEYMRIIKDSLLFVGIFTGVLVVFTMSFENIQILNDTGFFIGVIMSAAILVLFYMFAGTIFIFFHLITMSKSKAYIYSFIIEIILLSISKFMNIWTPVLCLNVFDMLTANQLFLDKELIEYLKIISLIMLNLVITYIVFKEKDILNEKN